TRLPDGLDGRAGGAGGQADRRHLIAGKLTDIGGAAVRRDRERVWVPPPDVDGGPGLSGRQGDRGDGTAVAGDAFIGQVGGAPVRRDRDRTRAVADVDRFPGTERKRLTICSSRTMAGSRERRLTLRDRRQRGDGGNRRDGDDDQGRASSEARSCHSTPPRA